MKKLKWLIVLAFSLLMVFGCESLTDSTDDVNNQTPIPDGFARVSGQIVLPDGVSPTELSSALIYTVGDESKKVFSDADGKFSILVEVKPLPQKIGIQKDNSSSHVNLKPKSESNYEYQLIIITKSSLYGKVVNLDTLAVKEEKNLGSVSVSKTGTLKGSAKLQNQTDHTGIHIYLPGTSFSAMTDSSGIYTLSNVPEGDYSYLRADKNGYYFSTISNIRVNSGVITTLPDILLNLSTGAIGGLIINSGDLYSTSLTVDLTIYSTNDAVLMMISDQPTLFGGVWKPVSAVDNYTFIYPGFKTLYIKFADANGLESPIYSANINITINPSVSLIEPSGTITETKPTFYWNAAQLSNVKYHLQVAKDQNFSNIVVDSTNIINANCTISKSLTNSTDYFWRVSIIDKDNHEWGWSSVKSFNVDLGTVNNPNPSNNQIVTTTLPLLSWSSLSNANKYELEVSDNAGFSNPVIHEYNLSVAQYQVVNALIKDKKYYWHVRIINSDGVAGAWSETWCFEAISATNVSGMINSNTTYTLANSPYYVSNSLNVAVGVTLTIEPGVKMLFAKDKGLQVSGTLIARGTDAAKITFTALKPQPGEWSNILFTTTATTATFNANDSYVSGSIMEYCDVSYGGGNGATGMIKADQTSPFINHCDVGYSSTSGIYLRITKNQIVTNSKMHNNYTGLLSTSPAYYDTGVFFKVTNSVIDSNNYNGINISGWYIKSIIEGCTISNNNGTGIGGYGNNIEIRNNNIFSNSNPNGTLTAISSYDLYGGGISLYSTSNVTIELNRLENNTGKEGGAICIQDGSGGGTTQKIMNNVISKNNATHGGGLYINKIQGGTLNLENNLIDENTSANYSVYFGGYGDSHTIKTNTFKRNKDNSNISTTLMIATDYSNPNLALISNNNFDNPTNRFEIMTNNRSGTQNINAKNNWWGTADENVIKTKIYDWYDNSSLGIIDYSNFLTQPNPNAPSKKKFAKK